MQAVFFIVTVWSSMTLACIQPAMTERHPSQENEPNQSGRTLVFVMLGIIIALIAAFLVLRPSPGGGRTPINAATPASQH